MTATVDRPPASPQAAWREQATWVPAPPGQQAFSLMLFILGGTVFFLLANLVLLSPIQHYASQNNLYSQLRLDLAQGSAPVSPIDSKGHAIAAGTPFAVMRAPGIGVGQEVIVEGSAGAQTMQGIGHKRDSVFPCQVGSSVLMARSGSYGGIGYQWSMLKAGDRFKITTGQGTCTYEVMDQRHVGDTAPAAPTGRDSRLVLTTAAGIPYLPTEVLRVDAKLVGKAFDRPTKAIDSSALAGSEAAMGSQVELAIDGKQGVDLATIFAIVLLLEVLVGAGIAAMWLWRRWGKWQTWLVAVPVIGTVGLLIATDVNQWFLPNLL